MQNYWTGHLAGVSRIVLVTFIEPAGEQMRPPQGLARFWRSFGAWQDDRPVVEHFSRIPGLRLEN